MKALVFGEILWDIIDATPHLGGAAFNFAAHLARLGAEVTMLSAVGADELGNKALEKAAGFGIDISHVKIDAQHPTGTVDVEVDAAGQPDYTIHENVAWDFIDLDADTTADLIHHVWDAVYIGTLAQRSEPNRRGLHLLLPQLRANQVFFDVNLRQTYFDESRIERSLLASTIVKINDDEARRICSMMYGGTMPVEAVARRLLDSFGLRVVIVTRGGAGAFVLSETAGCYTWAADVEIADTVGAGDSFSAGFLKAFLDGKPMCEAAKRAAGLADFVVTRAGAIPEYTPEIREFFR